MTLTNFFENNRLSSFCECSQMTEEVVTFSFKIMRLLQNSRNDLFQSIGYCSSVCNTRNAIKNQIASKHLVCVVILLDTNVQSTEHHILMLFPL